MKLRNISVVVIIAMAVIFYLFRHTLLSEFVFNRPTGSVDDKTTTLSAPADISGTQQNLSEVKPLLNTISREECQSIFEKSLTVTELTKTKNYALSKFVRTLDANSVSVTDKNTIGDVAGLSMKEMSLASSGLNQSEFRNDQGKIVLLADDYANRVELPSLDRNFFDEALKEKNYRKIIDAVNEHKIDPNQVRFLKSLLAQIFLEDSDISRENVEKLIASGLTINMDALVYAIKQGVSSDIVMLLSEKYNHDHLSTWQEDSTEMNLPLASAKALRTDLVGYFTNKGIQPFTTSYLEGGGNSLLDVLPKPKSPAQQRTALGLATAALAHGIKPIRTSSVKNLNEWLPEQTKQQYQSLLQPTIVPTDEVKKYASELKELIDSYDKKIAYAKNAEPRCMEQHHYDQKAYIRELIKKNPSSNNLSLAAKNSIYDYAKGRQEAMYKNPRKFLDDLKAAGAIITEVFATPISKQTNEQLFAATMDKRWQTAMEICDKAYAETGNKYAYTSLLSQYLWEDKADWDFVAQLLQRGAAVEPYLIHSLARKGNINLIEKLMPYGLDLNYVDNLGDNALSFAIGGVRNVKTVEFLLAHGVDVKLKTIVPDPLDVALAQMDIFSSAMKTEGGKPYFTTPQEVTALIRAGAPIEKSHREKIAMLKEINPDAYNALVQAVPELMY